jgi:hypothetical protein
MRAGHVAQSSPAAAVTILRVDCFATAALGVQGMQRFGHIRLSVESYACCRGGTHFAVLPRKVITTPQVVAMQLTPTVAFVDPAETASESAVRAQVRAALRAAGYPALADLDCRLVNGSIVLSGTVPTYYLKQVAQTVVLRLGATLRLDNCVLVRGE